MMSQLLVRDLEPAIVQKLRSQAASLGISVEEAHRRLLRTALFGDTPGPNDIEFPRSHEFPRPVEL